MISVVFTSLLRTQPDQLLIRTIDLKYALHLLYRDALGYISICVGARTKVHKHARYSKHGSLSTIVCSQYKRDSYCFDFSKLCIAKID